MNAPLTFQSGKRKYFGKKTKVAAHRNQRQQKVGQNRNSNFGKGYNNMPHDNAQKVKNTVSPAAHTQFDLDYPMETREHRLINKDGFLQRCCALLECNQKRFGYI